MPPGQPYSSSAYLTHCMCEQHENSSISPCGLHANWLRAERDKATKPLHIEIERLEAALKAIATPVTIDTLQTIARNALEPNHS